MGAINGRVIYSPKGKAGEYAENAANFFVGCSTVVLTVICAKVVAQRYWEAVARS